MEKKGKIFSFLWLCEFLFCVFMLTWLESLTSSRFPIGFCYQKTCDNKWWFSKSLILFCFQTASNFVTVLFFAYIPPPPPVFHKESKSKKCNSTFFAISISTIWNNRFSDFSCSLFSYQKGKKVWKFFFGNTDLIFLGIDVVT